MVATVERQDTTAPELPQRWRLVGATTGLVAVALYMFLGFVGHDFPDKPAAALAGLIGPLLACASIGLYQVLTSRRETIAGLLGAIANVAAGALLTAMLLVQTALDHAEDETPGLAASTERIFDHVHFGLDLAWDVFLCIGTVLFGLAMLRRPGFGPILGGIGIALAVALYVINFATFPEPPADEAVDLGPLVGLWYAVVCGFMLRRSATRQ